MFSLLKDTSLKTEHEDADVIRYVVTGSQR